MGKIDIFRNSSVTFHNASLRIVQATASTCSGRVLLRREGSDTLFLNDYGEHLLLLAASMVLVQVLLPIASVGLSICQSVWCIVEKRLIGSGCCLG